MLQPNRTFSVDEYYRYGFNGKENDNEVKGEGNQQDYGKRVYDPRLVKFLSVDPLTTKYPNLTPYQFASNRPIDGVDLDGMEWKPVKNDNNATVFYTWAGYGKNGKPAQGSVDHGTITNNGRVLTFSVHNKQAEVTRTYTNDNAGINAQIKDTWNANRKPNAETLPIIEFTGAVTKGDVGSVSAETKVFGIGFEFSSISNEQDIAGWRSNKLTLGGKEVSTGDKVRRNGYTASYGGFGGGEVVESRTDDAGKTSTTTTHTVNVPYVSANQTQDDKGTQGGYLTIPIFDAKYAAGYGGEAVLNINLPMGNNSAPSYLPQYGNAADNTGKKSIVPIDVSKLKMK